MVIHQFQRDQVRERVVDDPRRVRAYPTFNGGGGVEVVVEVPREPPVEEVADAVTDGQDATIKIWTAPQDEPALIPTIGAPAAVRTESTPCQLAMPGLGFDPARAPRYYGVSVQVVVGFTVVDSFQQVFELKDGTATPTSITPF